MSQLRTGVVVITALVGACGQVGVGPPAAVSAPMEPISSISVPDLFVFEGQTYAAFVAAPGMARYSLAELGVAGTSEAQRFNHAMANQRPALITAGGGVRALVFSGCAPSGCLEGLSVVAIDLSTGEAFVGVSDMSGTAKLAPNDRLEALLRLNSPSRSWDDPVRPPTTSAANP